MSNSEQNRSVDEREVDDLDCVEGLNDEASGIGASGNSREDGVSGAGVGLTDRLTDALVGDGDADLLIEQSDNRGERLIQFLQALDFQVMGACRADERLKPLLKLNVSCDVAEDRLWSYLSQHFEPAEVGMLARCLCVPLVTIRVGKITKQGTLLCPTAVRGNLSLTLLPTSDLRICFNGDDGRLERLSTISTDSRTAVIVEDIPSDSSGRSFLIKIPDCGEFYFWCSEKSLLYGNELIAKMNDLLTRKPSLAELTGISESRLNCFATHIRAYLVGSSTTKKGSSSLTSEGSSVSSGLGLPAHSLSLSKPLRTRHSGSLSGKSISGSLSPRSTSFKEGPPKTFSSWRNVVREKLKRQDGQFSCDSVSVASPGTSGTSSSFHTGNEKSGEANDLCLFSPNLLESLGKSTAPPFLSPVSQTPSIASSLLAPYYCWCPPIASTMQYTVAPPQLPTSSSEAFSFLGGSEPFSLPPLSTLLPSVRSSSVLTQPAPLDFTNLPHLDFPPLMPEPLVRLPLSRSNSQQIPMFTPLMCDPIVHIPVMDICSSGQSYLVSAGPAMSTTIPPLHSKFGNSLRIQEADSVEEGARETLRLLLSSSRETNSQLMNVFPSVLTSSADEKQSIFAAGSRGLYIGSSDVGAIANSIAAMGLPSLSSSDKSLTISALERYSSKCNFLEELEISGGSSCGGSCPEDDCAMPRREERTDG